MSTASEILKTAISTTYALMSALTHATSVTKEETAVTFTFSDHSVIIYDVSSNALKAPTQAQRVWDALNSTSADTWGDTLYSMLPAGSTIRVEDSCWIINMPDCSRLWVDILGGESEVHTNDTNI